MKTRIRLLVSQVFLSGFSWDDLENYLSVKKNILTQEIKNYFANQQDADEKFEKLISKIEENEREKNSNVRVISVR